MWTNNLGQGLTKVEIFQTEKWGHQAGQEIVGWQLFKLVFLKHKHVLHDIAQRFCDLSTSCIPDHLLSDHPTDLWLFCAVSSVLVIQCLFHIISSHRHHPSTASPSCSLLCHLARSLWLCAITCAYFTKVFNTFGTVCQAVFHFVICGPVFYGCKFSRIGLGYLCLSNVTDDECYITDF